MQANPHHFYITSTYWMVNKQTPVHAKKTLALWCPMICHGQIILLTLPTKLTRSLVCSAGLFATTIAQVLRKGSMYHLLDLNYSTALKFGAHIYVKILKKTKIVLHMLYMIYVHVHTYVYV